MGLCLLEKWTAIICKMAMQWHYLLQEMNSLSPILLTLILKDLEELFSFEKMISSLCASASLKIRNSKDPQKSTSQTALFGEASF